MLIIRIIIFQQSKFKFIIFIACLLLYQLSSSAKAQEIEVPQWFDEARYQVHSRLQIGRREDFASRIGFFEASKYLGKMGIKVHTRHLKSGCEGAIWESKIGSMHPAVKEQGNIAKRIIAASHQEGLKIICYYRHFEDCNIVVQHPDWQCRDKTNELLNGRRGPWLSLASPYVDFLTIRLSELVEMGADGFYFDATHVPIMGDFSEHARKLYFDSYNKVLVNSSDSEVKEFRQLLIERAFSKIRDSLVRQKDDIVLLLSANTVALKNLKNFYVKWEPNFWERGTFPTLPIAATILRDASAGRPTHCWFNNSHTNMPINEVARYLAFNTIINRDISDDTLANNNPIIYTEFEEEINLANKISPFISGTKSLSTALIFIDENFVVRLDNFSKPFEKVFNQLRSEKVSIGSITETQVERGIPESCKLLVFPELDSVPDRCLKSIRSFISKGGSVLLKSDLAVRGYNLTKNVEKKVDIKGGGKGLDVLLYGKKSSSDYCIVLTNVEESRIKLKIRSKNENLRITDIIEGEVLKTKKKRKHTSVVLKEIGPMGFIRIETN